MLSDLHIIFLTSSIHYPFYRNRLISFNKIGLSFEVLGFERELKYPSTDLPIQYEKLGNIDQGNYMKRLMHIISAIPKIRKRVKNADVIYAFGLDMALASLVSVSFLTKCPKLVYEVHDIREILTRDNITGIVARYIDKLVVRKTDILVVTSIAYVTNYFKNV